jgi:hypothetical protein
MRGVIHGAMMVAVGDLGLTAAFDDVYALSAGVLNSAYFVAGGGKEGQQVPWRPQHRVIALDSRLGRYSWRVTRICDGTDEVGLLLVVPEVYSEITGGALWWRRWSESRHAAMLYLVLPGWEFEFTDTIVLPDDLPEEVDNWDLGRLSLFGETYALRWLDEGESRRLASDWFGMEKPT